MNRDALLREITILDFTAVDLGLYLNTHPEDSEALEMYNDCIRSSKAARGEYEQQFGPLTGARSEAQSGAWTWKDNPWPWTEEFNFVISGGN